MADTGDGPAVVEHEDGGQQQQVTLHDVNQDEGDTNDVHDMLREQTLQSFAALPSPAAGPSGPAGKTAPGFAVMSEQGEERIED
ncbi:hypothetical protein AB0O22_17920 [Streptomyces sp. NPDC091204]|uniref:hypothetical protein n=1 Tax=Streptomyces sp. NPDC091204 TaxID=3155299 RepID=UPI0034451AF9